MSEAKQHPGNWHRFAHQLRKALTPAKIDCGDLHIGFLSELSPNFSQPLAHLVIPIALPYRRLAD